MIDYAIILINLTMAFVTAWIVNQYLTIFFIKKKKRLTGFFVWSVFYIFQVIVAFNKGNASIWIILLDILLISLITVTDFEKVKNRKFLYVLLLFVFWMIVEIFSYYIVKLLPIGDAEFDIAGSVLSKLMVLVFVNILNMKLNLKGEATIPVIYYLLMLFIPFGSVFIAHNIFIIDRNDYKGITMITLSIIMISNLIIFKIYAKIASSYILQKENMIYEKQVQLLARNTEEQKKAMEDFYKEKHNLINQLIVLKENVEYDRKQDAVRDLKYLIQTTTTNVERICSSGNSVVDALINFKYSSAKEMGIDFKLKIFIPEELPIEQRDLGIILGNSLDNAMEATRLCETQKKIIRIYMGLKKGAIVLAVVNPYYHTLRWDDYGNLKTTKKENNRHGYGMGFIRKAVEKYQGDVLVAAENGIFTLTVIMNA